MTGFEPAASCSQSRRATNCATPGYEVVGWPGRILPNHARYQLRNTSIGVSQWETLDCPFIISKKSGPVNGFYSVYILARPPSLVSRYLENRSRPVSYMVFTTISKEIFRV